MSLNSLTYAPSIRQALAHDNAVRARETNGGRHVMAQLPNDEHLP